MSRSVLRFFLHRFLAFVVVPGFVVPHVALHRVSIRTLEELSWYKLGAGWGSRGESMLPLLVRSLPGSGHSIGYGQSSFHSALHELFCNA